MEEAKSSMILALSWWLKANTAFGENKIPKNKVKIIKNLLFLITTLKI